MLYNDLGAVGQVLRKGAVAVLCSGSGGLQLSAIPALINQVKGVSWGGSGLYSFSSAASGGGLWGRLRRTAAWGNLLLKHPELVKAAPDLLPLLLSGP